MLKSWIFEILKKVKDLKMSNFAVIQKIVAEATESDLMEVTEQSTIEDIVGWDSLGHLAIMTAMAENFKHLAEDVRLQNVRSVKELMDLANDNVE